MPGLASKAIPAAIAGGSLLFGDDAEAGILRKGATAARDHLGYKPLAVGEEAGKFLAFGNDQRVIDRKIELLSEIMKPKNGGQGAGFKTFQDFMHQKSNYDDWSVLAEIEDGQRRGDHYKDGVDAFLEYIVEKAPELEPYVNKYGNDRFGMSHQQQLAKQGMTADQYNPPIDDKLNRSLWLDRAANSPGLLDPGFAFEPKTLNVRNRATGEILERPSSSPAHAKTHPDAPEGYVFSHNASARPKVQRVGMGGKGRNKGPKEPETFIDPVTGRKKRKGPVSFGMGAPIEAIDDHNAAVAKDMDTLGLTADPMYDYGTLLPIKQDITTGETSLAAPDILRTVVGGLLSLGNTPKTGVYDPNSLLDVML